MLSDGQISRQDVLERGDFIGVDGVSHRITGINIKGQSVEGGQPGEVTMTVRLTIEKGASSKAGLKVTPNKPN